MIGIMLAVVLGGELIWAEIETLTSEGLRAGASVAGAR
jgi:hypothetical protein